MPEIWLPYGSVEVAVSLKAENLAEHITPKHTPMSEESIRSILKGVEAKGRTCVFAPKPSIATIDVVKRLLEELAVKGVAAGDVTVLTDRRYIANIRKILADKGVKISEAEKPTETVGKVGEIEVKIPKTLSESETRIMVTNVGFDPLFGFTGGPPALVRQLGGDLMAEAFRRRRSDHPAPAVVSDPALFADEAAGLLRDTSAIEVVSFEQGVSGVYVGGLVDTHRAASKHLLEAAKVSVPGDARAILVSAGGSEFDATLADSLNAVWNVADGLRDRGFLTLIAECSAGLGSEALRMYLSGRLDVESFVRRGEYIDGLEDLIYIKTILHRHNLILVSTLPNYFTEMKLGFHACRKAGDALSYILSSASAKTKVYVLPHGSTTLLSKKEG